MFPGEHFVDAQHGVVITLYSGHVTRQDLVNSMTMLRNCPGFRPNFRQLANLTGASKLDLDFTDLYGIRHVYDPFSRQSRRAIVAPQNGAGHGLARMYQAIVDSEHMEVFVSVLDAISWLGLEVTVLEAAIQRGRTSSRVKVGASTILDLPPAVPQTFRPIRKKLKNVVGQRKV